MNLTESLRVALRALLANKMRSALTMLGMIIGVSAVITLMSVGAGAQATVTARIQSMGTNLLFIRPGAASQGGVRAAAGTRPTLTYEDAVALADPLNCSACALVAPEVMYFAQVVAGPQNTNTRILGVTPEYQEVRNFHVAEGEFISRQNVIARSLVAVLGSGVAEGLFGEENPIGQSIRINRINFRVIGVMETKGTQGFGSQDDLVLLPITTIQQRLMAQRTARGRRNVSTINVQLIDGKPSTKETAVQQIGEVLRQRHRVAEDDFTIGSQEDLLAVASQVTGIMTLLLGSIAGISLLVGGIGIMNIMLVSVTERTREIGIRKAIGAKRRDILLQFLIESAVVSLAGGVAGILLGMAMSQALSHLRLGGQTIPSVVTIEAVALAFGVSAIIGLFFGIYPASRASRLNPIDALRYE
jgi:putative ABC transport system permease protein